VPARVIDAQINIATSAGRATGAFRLITTLLDPGCYPASEIVTLHYQRWDIETAYLELRSSNLSGRALRARTPAGVHQQVSALLVTYQILRAAMADGITTSRASTRTGPTSCPAGGCTPAPEPSNSPSPSTTPAALASTGAPTKPPSLSASTRENT
jgi:Transposase DDE domain